MRTARVLLIFVLLAAGACGRSETSTPAAIPPATTSTAPTPVTPSMAPSPVAPAAPAQAPVIASAPTQAPIVGSSSGDPGTITYLAVEQGVPARWDPCRPIRYRVNPANAPEGGIAIIHQAVKKAAVAAGLPFRNDGTTNVVLQPYLDPNLYGIDVVIGWQHGIGAEASLMYLSKVLPTPKGPRIAAAEIVLNADRQAPMEFTGGTRSTWGWGTRLLYRLGNTVNVAAISAPDQVMSEQTSPDAPEEYGAADRTALASLGESAGCLPDA